MWGREGVLKKRTNPGAQPGWCSQLSDRLLVSAQVVILS